ncbi:MAG: response regulator [Candidatus Adiutrix sp.]|nr:response regulator [Candidatus Adiutrix sp.]
MANRLRVCKPAKYKTVFLYAFPLALLWTMAVGLSLWLGIEKDRGNAAELARLQGRAALERDTLYLLWHIKAGGLYVSASDDMPPSPYPGETPWLDQDIVTPGGVRLTKFNPARLLYAVSRMAPSETGIVARITSLDPINPVNLPDPWEEAALMAIEESGLDEVSEITKFRGRDYMRIMQPLAALKGCLDCHKVYGDSMGSMRGGLSAAVPMAPILASTASSIRMLILSHASLYLIGVIVLFMGASRMATRDSQRDQAVESLRELTTELEERVAARTANLRRSKMELQSFMDHTAAGVYLADLNGNLTMVNPRFANIMGVPPGDLMGTSGFDRTPEATAAAIKQAEETVCRKVRPVEISDLFWSDNEKGPVYSLSAFPILNPQGQLEGLGGFIIDVTERYFMEKELIKARDAAEHASRAKSDFLANISHEVRTPLNGVIGMTDMLLKTDLSPDQASMAATIKTAGDSLLRVLNDILDISKIEAGKMVIDASPFSLRDVIFDAVKGLAPIAYKKALEITVNIAPKMPDAFSGDYVRIRQILLNLVSNAIKFTEKGEISVSVRMLEREGDQAVIRISVADTGIGIPEKKQKIIFEAFEQADTSTTREYGGTGLGLAICYRLAALMGSQLRLESEEGFGSVFWLDLTLPVLPEDDSSKPSVDLKQLERVPVLFVDDSDTNRVIGLEQLDGWHMAAFEAASVDQAMRVLKSAAYAGRPFRLVLSDYQMPDKNGVEFINLIRRDPILADLPVILMSSSDDFFETVKQDPLATTLFKPVRPDDLLRAIVACLGIWERFDADDIIARDDAAKEAITGLKVLLAEDMEINRMVATRIMESLGHQVALAVNGREAVEAVEREDFDLVFMDIQMPILDGTAATALIREREEKEGRRHVPMVAMTAHALKGDRDKYLAAGLDGYLTKPITSDSVIEVITEMSKRFDLKGATRGREERAAEKDAPEATAAAAAPSVLDLEIMAKSLGRDQTLISKSMELYLRDAPGLIGEIRAALARADAPAAAASAHALKGISSYYTRGGVFALAVELDKAARASAMPDDLAALEALTDELEKALNEMIEAMLKWLGDDGAWAEGLPSA